ncbi:MAG TPA: preprotein translocase subunit SecE [Pseudonocardiaceae bacterium]
MSEDREQDPGVERESVARPVTAAARRERRASARGETSARGRVEDQVPVGAGAGTRRRRPADGGGKTTPSKAELGIETAKRDRADKQPGLIARLAKFVREVVSELRKVIWPTRKQQITYTIVVLVFVSFIVALVSGLDLLFDKGVFWIFS